MAIPVTPPISDLAPANSVQPVQGTPVALTTGVTLTAPTSATLITGMTQAVPIQTGTSYLLVHFTGTNATVTAAATVTIGCYTGATSGALTTLKGTRISTAPTGGLSGVNSTFIFPIAGSLWNTTIYVSIAATASTGDYVLNASSTSPAGLTVLAL